MPYATTEYRRTNMSPRSEHQCRAGQRERLTRLVETNQGFKSSTAPTRFSYVEPEWRRRVRAFVLTGAALVLAAAVTIFVATVFVVATALVATALVAFVVAHGVGARGQGGEELVMKTKFVK